MYAILIWHFGLSYMTVCALFSAQKRYFQRKYLKLSKSQCFGDSKHIFKSKIASVFHEKNAFELCADFVRIKIFTMVTGVCDLFLSLKRYFRTKYLK
jgi:hypothetical protein